MYVLKQTSVWPGYHSKFLHVERTVVTENQVQTAEPSPPILPNNHRSNVTKLHPV